MLESYPNSLWNGTSVFRFKCPSVTEIMYRGTPDISSSIKAGPILYWCHVKHHLRMSFNQDFNVSVICLSCHFATTRLSHTSFNPVIFNVGYSLMRLYCSSTRTDIAASFTTFPLASALFGHIWLKEINKNEQFIYVSSLMFCECHVVLTHRS
jgi:hypothetical protein